MPSVNEIQVAGTHYRSKLQHWDFVGMVLCGRYLEGCATKYPTRWRKKGEGLKDLRKSAHYIDKVIEGFTTGVIMPLKGSRPPHIEANIPQLVSKFCHVNDIHREEAEIIKLLSNWSSLADLLQAKALLYKLIEAEEVIEAEIKEMRQENP